MDAKASETCRVIFQYCGIAVILCIHNMIYCGSHRPWTPLLDTSPRLMP